MMSLLHDGQSAVAGLLQHAGGGHGPLAVTAPHHGLAVTAPHHGFAGHSLRPSRRHIPGAVNVPHDQLAARLAELPENVEIIAYCRGRYCVFAPDAVRLLRARGFSAWLLEGGLPDWRRAGLPVTDRASAGAP
jgi:3-mercaptopyruvate sulfurtransferase SseA